MAEVIIQIDHEYFIEDSFVQCEVVLPPTKTGIRFMVVALQFTINTESNIKRKENTDNFC